MPARPHVTLERTVDPVTEPTLGEWLAAARDRLIIARLDDERAAGLPRDADAARREAHVEAERLCLEVLDRPRSHLYAWSDRRLQTRARAAMDALLVRRLEGVPLAHLLGRREFWSLEFEVSPDVLVPRSDTECLVERALVFTAGRVRPRVLDAGTGSGAIAIAVAHECDADVIALDRSDAALAVARRNASRLVGSRVVFVQGDWLDAIGEGTIDLLLANPPYLAVDDPHLRTADLQAEPQTALIAGEDGLEALRRLVEAARRVLRPGGEAWFEHGTTQGAAVHAMLQRAGLAEPRTLTDLAGQPRLTGAQQPCS